ncbi:porin family protein [Lewinella sp. 4G2]|uniref:porin family protein n=1 Tax=Lewinella sp. 4G2 TaxID=1803372 RepID=UPI0007B4BA44|nr:porin family protein [Lewinella sp. 4G2]OAV43185.1 hypothetical protein A3850_001145 [Lewinella sp. 4G2]
MRTLFSLLAFLCFTVAVSAQTSVGIRGAYGTSSLRTDSDLDLISDQLDNTSTLSAGLYVEHAFTEVFSLRSGVEINRRGTSLALTQDAEIFGMNVGFGARAKTRFTYVDVPVLAQVHLPTNSAVTPYAFGGASLGYATAGNIRTTATALVEFNLMTTDINLDAINYERFHVAAMGGVGVKAKAGENLTFFVEGRFEQSLTQPYDVPIVTARTGFKGVQVGGGVAVTF